MNTSITPQTGHLNLESARAIVARLGYRPGWKFEITSGYRHWRLEFEGPGIDAYDHKRSITIAQCKPLPDLDLITEDALIGFARLALQQLELHEVDEFFTYAGARPFDPHRREPEDWILCRTCGQRTR